MEGPNFYTGAHTPNMERSQFRGIYLDVLRISKLTGKRDIMSFGPNLCSIEDALDEGFIRSPEEFKPELFVAHTTMPIKLEGDTYETASIFFKQGGNDSADKKWLGNLTFRNEQRQLEYRFGSNGSIHAERSTDGSPWVENLFVRAPQADNLQNALDVLKQDIHERSVGACALSETVTKPQTTAERMREFLFRIFRSDDEQPRVLAGGV